MRNPIESEAGQATIEYLVVGLVLIAMMGALAALWRFISTGDMTSLLEASSSHAMNTIGGICDALLF